MLEPAQSEPAHSESAHLEPVLPAPERWLVISRQHAEPGEEPRYLLVRWPDWPHPALLSIAPPSADDTLDDAVGSLLKARLQLDLEGPARVGDTRMPVRMAQPRYGLSTTGWLRAVSVEVSGEPEADSLLDGFEVLTADEALRGLTTDLERAVFRMGVALF